MLYLNSCGMTRREVTEYVLDMFIRHIKSAGDDKDSETYKTVPFLTLELQCHAGNGNNLRDNKNGCKEAIDRLI